MIAQDVEKIFPEVVYHKILDSSKQDVYTMNYSAFGVIALKAIQEQQSVIKNQQATIEKLQSDVEDLKRIIMSTCTTSQSLTISKRATDFSRCTS